MSYIKLSFVLTFLFSGLINCYSNIDPIEVANLTFKVGGLSSEELYYGFAKGDIIIITFEEVNDKPLKEIDITELPSHSKFMDFKVTNINEQQITVNETSVYEFKFHNSSVKGRVCKIKIQRIPKSEEYLDFNTSWEWKTIYDTIYTDYTEDSIIGYDTTFITKTKREVLSVDTTVVELFNKNEVVHSSTNLQHSQYSYISVNLPSNTYSPNIFKPYESKEVIAWAYWIGVGQQSLEQYEKANKEVKDGISAVGSMLGYGGLTNLALKGISVFKPVYVGENVIYKFLYSKNGQIYTFDSGDVISASGRNTSLLQGAFTIELYNDNFKDGITVNVKVIAVQTHTTWHDVEYMEYKTEAVYQTLNKKKMTVEKTEIRVNAQ